jgi:phenylpyruvate tautomerase
MPYIHTTVSTKLDDAKRANLTTAFKTVCSKVLAKPEEYVMTAFNDETPIAFRGTTDPCACIRVEVYSEYAPAAPAKATPVITAAVSKECGIPADRIYVVYYSTPHVGWNGNNF